MNASVIHFGRAGELDLSKVAWKRVTESCPIALSPFHKVPQDLRWMPVARIDQENVIFYVAQSAPRGKKRARYYFLTDCHQCGGYYFASRIDTRFCSSRCRGANKREIDRWRKSVLTDSMIEELTEWNGGILDMSDLPF